MRATASDLETAATLSVRLSGTGGQGLLLMGRLLADAAALYDDLNVVQTKSYGPEARGGASKSDVILSGGIIDDIGNRSVDILLCLSQMGCDKYFSALKPSGLLLVDSSNVKVVPTSRAVELPLTEAATTRCGTKMVANVVALGALSAYANVVRLTSLKKAVRAYVKPAFVQLNLKALDLGADLARKALAALSERQREAVVDYSYLKTAESKPAPAAKRPAKKAAPRKPTKAN